MELTMTNNLGFCELNEMEMLVVDGGITTKQALAIIGGCAALGALGGTITGGIAGGVAGSAIPGLGTVAGAALGCIGGFANGALSGAGVGVAVVGGIIALENHQS